MLTYDDFLKTKKRSENLRVDAPAYTDGYDTTERPVLKGYVYCDAYVIEELEDGRFYLLLANQDWIEPDIAELEPRLYEFVKANTVDDAEVT
jgi:hypothetical protein